MLKHTKSVARNPRAQVTPKWDCGELFTMKGGGAPSLNAAAAVAAVGAVAFELPLPLPSHNKGDDDIQRLAAVSLTDTEGQCNRFWQ